MRERPSRKLGDGYELLPEFLGQTLERALLGLQDLGVVVSQPLFDVLVALDHDAPKPGRKATANIQKHGVSFEAAARAFEDEFSATFPDPGHSSGEIRLIPYGVGDDGKLLVVAHTKRRYPHH